MVIFSIFLFAAFLWALFLPEAAHAATPALKMLSTPSCSACARMEQILNELSKKYEGKVTTEKINLQKHPEIAKRHNVRYVPHLLFLNADGNVFKEETGVLPLDKVLRTFKEAGISIE